MNKLQAFLSHFAISAVIVGAVFAVIWFLWYPAPLFQVVGAWNIIRVLIVVDLVLGPLLTLVVYKPGKKGLVFDMGVIATIQLAALVYGVSAIYAERPCFMVFSVDRFEALSCKSVDLDQLAARDDLTRRSWWEPLYVVARMPDDPAARSRLLQEVMFEGKPDLPQRIEFWTNFDGQALADVRARSVLARDVGLEAPLEARAIAAAGPDARLLPLPAGDGLAILVLDPETLKAVASLPGDYSAITGDDP
jgi:hypothetical protein